MTKSRKDFSNRVAVRLPVVAFENDVRLRQVPREISGRHDVSTVSGLDDYRPAPSAVERERRRLARDIHDLSGQYIVAALFRLDALERASGNGALSRHCNDIREMLVQLSRELEKVTSGSENTAPDGSDLITALSDLIGRWEDHIGIATRFLHEAAKNFRIDDATAETLFRITQEALTNVAKHAATATLVTIRLRQIAACLVLTIEDDGTGKGRQPMPEDRGFHRPSGIAGMRERVAELGGTLRLERTARGTRLIVAVPTERSSIQQCERGLA